MPPLAELDVPTWDYTDETITGPRFHEVMLGLAEQSWIARADPVGWIVLDHEAVEFFMRTKQANFPGILMLEVQGVTEGPMWDRMKGNLLDLRGEDHRRQRKLVQHAFTPKEADKLRPLMRQELEKMWDAVAADGGCEFVEAFAKPYPARMIAGVMGSPLEDAPQLGHWANLIQKQFDPVAIATMLPTLEQASTEFVEYVDDLIQKRKGDPKDDLITYLIQAEEDGASVAACRGDAPRLPFVPRRIPQHAPGEFQEPVRPVRTGLHPDFTPDTMGPGDPADHDEALRHGWRPGPPTRLSPARPACGASWRWHSGWSESPAPSAPACR